MNGKIYLKNMVFYGYHGHRAEESSLGQRFMIDLVMTLDIAEATRTDNLQSTVDYVEGLRGICRQIVEHDRVKLIETLANHLIDRILEACPRVTKVEITIKKPRCRWTGCSTTWRLKPAKNGEHGVSRAGRQSRRPSPASGGGRAPPACRAGPASCENLLGLRVEPLSV